MRDAAYAGLQGQRVGRRRSGRRDRDPIHPALLDQRPHRSKRGPATVAPLSATATVATSLPPLRGGLAALIAPSSAAVGEWLSFLLQVLDRTAAGAARFAGRWIRPLPVAAALLLVASALTAAALVQVAPRGPAANSNAGSGVPLLPVDGQLQKALLATLLSLGSATELKQGSAPGGIVDTRRGTAGSVRFGRYAVGAGDTLTGLAYHFGVSLDTIISFNDIKRERELKVGRELLIPSQSGIRYTVRRGDNLSRIAARHDVPLATLLDVNGVESSLITPGQQLLIPGARLSENARNRVLGQLFVRPSRGRLTSSYGFRSDPFTGLRKFHNGVDIANQRGTAIVAAMSGTVAMAGYNGNYGRYLIVRHADGFQTLYAHLDQVLVAQRQRVRQGQRVGEMGNTGYSTANHLHFSIFLNGAHVDPMEHLE